MQGDGAAVDRGDLPAGRASHRRPRGVMYRITCRSRAVIIGVEPLAGRMPARSMYRIRAYYRFHRRLGIWRA